MICRLLLCIFLPSSYCLGGDYIKINYDEPELELDYRDSAAENESTIDVTEGYNDTDKIHIEMVSDIFVENGTDGLMFPALYHNEENGTFLDDVEIFRYSSSSS